MQNASLIYSCCPMSRCSRGVWMARSNSGMLEPNGFMGFQHDEAIGCSSHALLQTKFPLEFTQLCSHFFTQRSFLGGELRHSCKDGREVVVDSRIQLLGDGTVLEVNRDTTQVKAFHDQQARLHVELDATTAKFEALFNQSGIFAGIMDPQGSSAT